MFVCIDQKILIKGCFYMVNDQICVIKEYFFSSEFILAEIQKSNLTLKSFL